MADAEPLTANVGGHWCPEYRHATVYAVVNVDNALNKWIVMNGFTLDMQRYVEGVSYNPTPTANTVLFDASNPLKPPIRIHVDILPLYIF
jgi:hypothetical protein